MKERSFLGVSRRAFVLLVLGLSLVSDLDASQIVFDTDLEPSQGTPATYVPVAISGDVIAAALTSADEVEVFHRIGDTWVSQAVLTGPDGFGQSISADDNRIAIGAPHDSGLVLLFERDLGGTDAWGLAAQLEPEPGDGRLGHKVSLDGQTLAVSAGGGRIAIFEHDGALWSRAHTIEVSAAGFGSTLALALAGTTLVATSAPCCDPGVAIVFEHIGSGWIETARLESSQPDDYEYFGASAAIDGDVIMIGAPYSPGPVRGAVYEFERSGNSWLPASRVASENDMDEGRFSGLFGYAIALDSGRLLAGSPSEAFCLSAPEADPVPFDSPAGREIRTRCPCEVCCSGRTAHLYLFSQRRTGAWIADGETWEGRDICDPNLRHNFLPLDVSGNLIVSGGPSFSGGTSVAAVHRIEDTVLEIPSLQRWGVALLGLALAAAGLIDIRTRFRTSSS